jgi:hypothetical protein
MYRGEWKKDLLENTPWSAGKARALRLQVRLGVGNGGQRRPISEGRRSTVVNSQRNAFTSARWFIADELDALGTIEGSGRQSRSPYFLCGACAVSCSCLTTTIVITPCPSSTDALAGATRGRRKSADLFAREARSIAIMRGSGVFRLPRPRARASCRSGRNLPTARQCQTHSETILSRHWPMRSESR